MNNYNYTKEEMREDEDGFLKKWVLKCGYGDGSTRRDRTSE